MATIKGAFKLPNGDILYPETSPDQIINLKNTILDESIYDIYTQVSSGLSDQDIKDMLSEVLSYYNSVGTHAKLCRV